MPEKAIVKDIGWYFPTKSLYFHGIKKGDLIETDVYTSVVPGNNASLQLLSLFEQQRHIDNNFIYDIFTMTPVKVGDLNIYTDGSNGIASQLKFSDKDLIQVQPSVGTLWALMGDAEISLGAGCSSPSSYTGDMKEYFCGIIDRINFKDIEGLKTTIEKTHKRAGRIVGTNIPFNYLDLVESDPREPKKFMRDRKLYVFTGEYDARTNMEIMKKMVEKSGINIDAIYVHAADLHKRPERVAWAEYWQPRIGLVEMSKVDSSDKVFLQVRGGTAVELANYLGQGIFLAENVK